MKQRMYLIYYILSKFYSGFGDIYPETLVETIYACFVCVIGPIFYAVVVANVASYALRSVVVQSVLNCVIYVYAYLIEYSQ